MKSNDKSNYIFAISVIFYALGNYLNVNMPFLLFTFIWMIISIFLILKTKFSFYTYSALYNMIFFLFNETNSKIANLIDTRLIFLLLLIAKFILIDIILKKKTLSKSN